MLLARSAPEGEADEIAMNPDIDTRRSAVGGKADVPATWPGSPLLAKSGSAGAHFFVQKPKCPVSLTKRLVPLKGVGQMVTIGIRFLCRNFVFSSFSAAC